MCELFTRAWLIVYGFKRLIKK